MTGRSKAPRAFVRKPNPAFPLPPTLSRNLSRREPTLVQVGLFWRKTTCKNATANPFSDNQT